MENCLTVLEKIGETDVQKINFSGVTFDRFRYSHEPAEGGTPQDYLFGSLRD